MLIVVAGRFLRARMGGEFWVLGRGRSLGRVFRSRFMFVR